MAVRVKLSVAVMPTTAMLAPVPVPAATPKLATDPAVNDWSNGPVGEADHFAVLSADPSAAK